MMRAIFALIVSLPVAALGGTATFLTACGDLGIVAVPSLLWSLPLIGAVATAPGWVIALLIFLPLATHRAARAPLPARWYYPLAAAAGGVSPLMSPMGMLAVSSDEIGAIFLVILASGAVGGLCFAACWRAIVLKPLAARRGASWETLHG